MSKQSFSLQPRFRLFEGELQPSGAHRLERIDQQLIFAFGFIDAQAAASPDQHAVFQAKTNALIDAAITRGSQLSEFIFQGEVPVARSVRAKIRDLAFDPN